jgi:LPS export ABC transporter protein LptC
VAVCLLPLAACRRSRPPIADVQAPPFVFRSLDLKQQDAGGRPAWKLTSPEARYDLRRRLARAERPQGLIYAKGQPLYRLQADSGMVIGDGQAILLEGNLRVERLAKPEVLIQAARARWLPQQKLLLVDRRPEA